MAAPDPFPGSPDLPDVVEGVSCSIPDLDRETVTAWAWQPSRRLLRALRLFDAARRRGGPIGAALRRYAVAEHRFWSAVTGADIPLGTQLGFGLLMPHPNGIVLHPAVRLGPNCLLMQQVTLGVSKPGSGVPRLEGHVDVSAGAKILGSVTIGRHALIGANAVVLTDVPPGGIAVGVPARVVASRVPPGR